MGQLCPLNTSTTKKEQFVGDLFNTLATQQPQQNSCSRSEETKQSNGNCHTVSHKITQSQNHTQSVTKSHPISHEITHSQSQNHTQSVTKSHQ